jgi:hypothetical protein
MYRWRITLFGKTPARALGIVVAPDQQSATQKAIEFFGIERSQHFRIVAIKLEKVSQREQSKQRNLSA